MNSVSGKLATYVLSDVETKWKGSYVDRWCLRRPLHHV